MIEQAILAQYKKVVGKEEPVQSVCSPSERLKVLEQLKTDGLISEEEYSTKRKEILGEL
jgi:Short C-terminal domain